MAKFSEQQIELRFLAMEKRRDAIRKQASDQRYSPSTRMALARASDAITAAMELVKREPAR